MKQSPNKKGNMVITFAAGLALGVVAITVLAILLSAVQSTSTACTGTNTYNATDNTCQNASGTKFAMSSTGNITTNGLTFLQNTSAQFGTAGTVLGVSLLLIIIAGVGFGAYKMYERTR